MAKIYVLSGCAGLEKASTELGIAKEYELKYNIEKSIDIHLDKYLENGIEFDLVGEKDGVVYIFEIKWRAKETGYKEFEKLSAKVARSEFSEKPQKLIFISRRGFTKQAIEYAKNENIVLVTERDISKIKGLLK